MAEQLTRLQKWHKHDVVRAKAALIMEEIHVKHGLQSPVNHANWECLTRDARYNNDPMVLSALSRLSTKAGLAPVSVIAASQSLQGQLATKVAGAAIAVA